MVRAIRRRLILYSFAVICLVALIIAGLSYLVLSREDMETVDALLWETAYTQRLPAGYAPDARENVLLLRAGTEGALISSEARWVLQQNIYAELARKTASSGSNQGIVSDADLRRYVFLRLEDAGEYVIALREIPGTWAFLRPVLPVMLLLLGVALLLIYGASRLITSRAMAPVYHVWDGQQRFTAGAARTLRKPVAEIRANIDKARVDPEATVGSVRRWLDGASSGAKRLALLVEYLLQLARGDGGEAMQAERFNLSATVSGAAGHWVPTAQENGLGFEIDVQPGLHCIGQPEDIVQLVDMLLSNAMKYTPAPGAVALVLRSHKGAARLMVEDGGIGMSEEQIEHIFDRFYRADILGDAVEGYGLGLAIALQIVQRFGGDIHVRSAPGEGSCFSVTLPRISR